MQEIKLAAGQRFYTGLGHRPFTGGETIHVAPGLAEELQKLGIAEKPVAPAAPAAPAPASTAPLPPPPAPQPASPAPTPPEAGNKPI